MQQEIEKNPMLLASKNVTGQHSCVLSIEGRYFYDVKFSKHNYTTVNQIYTVPDTPSIMSDFTSHLYHLGRIFRDEKLYKGKLHEEFYRMYSEKVEFIKRGLEHKDNSQFYDIVSECTAFQ